MGDNFDEKIDLASIIASGKTIGDEMNPDINVDDTVDQKIDVSMLVQAENKNKILVEQSVNEPEPKKIKKTYGKVIFGLAICVVVIYVSWILIF